nr:glycoside hydrolase family 3 C-terminal domain-containing protein [Bacteroidales bacterium]
MKKILTTLALAALALPVLAQPQLRKDNIDEVLKAMTLEEKATLVVGSSRGMTQLAGITMSASQIVPGAAGTTQSIPRLGIPNTVVADGPAGLRISPTRQNTNDTFYCTGFPVGEQLASTWNVELIESVGMAMGNEVHEYGVDVLLAPGMKIHRNPLCGRNFEYYSEDPLLAGYVATAYINGIQSNGVGVSAKHFAANNQETNRNQNDARINQRALREIYLKPFEMAVKNAQPWTVMSSYNQLNGAFTQQSRDLLTTILRDEWGFQGIVMTDWGNKEGTVKAVQAGNDLMEPGNPVETERIVNAVKNGTLSEEFLDINVRRMLEYIVKTPRFNGYKYSDKPDLKAHAEITRKSATEGMILLRNEDSVLPFKDVKNVALFGVTSYDFIAGGTGSGNVNKPYVVSLLEGLANAGLKVDSQISDYYQKYMAYESVRIANEGGGGNVLLGRATLPEMSVGRNFIDRHVASTDIALITIGRQAGEGADRKVDNDWNLTEVERALIKNVSEAYHLAGKKVVVILNIGGVIETVSWKNLVDGILVAWGPGQEGGNSVADVLTGKANPSGKLPMTFPVSYLDHPSSYNFPANYTNTGNAGMMGMMGMGGAFGRARAPQKNVDYTEYAEGIWVGYRYFTTAGKEVSYPFGYGLSYTTFEYGKPTV